MSSSRGKRLGLSVIPVAILIALAAILTTNLTSSAQTTIPIGVDAYVNHIASEPSGLTYVYKYIVPGGQSLVPSYINTAYANGKKPILVIYTNYGGTTPDWSTWDAAMSAIAQDGRDVDVVVEPDMFGYIRNQNACGTTGRQVVDRFLSTAPSNAHLGFFMSPWMVPYRSATADAASWKACWEAAGGDRMEDIYVDVTDRDQEYRGEYPWSASRIQMYEDWFKALANAMGRKIGVWQIPLGNSQCANGRRSNFVENWLTQSKLVELAPYVDKLLFGPGVEDYDSANTQSWNLPQHVKYECGLFNSTVNALAGGSPPTPTRTATRTPGPTSTPTATRTPGPTRTPTPTGVPGADSDNDGVPDTEDNCRYVYNPDQAASHAGPRPAGSQIPGGWASNPANDPRGDACTTHPDPVISPFTNTTDSDGEGLADSLETKYETCRYAVDPSVGYSNCTNPADSDGDGCSDMVEVLDVNGDRRTNTIDVLIVAKRACGMIPPSDSDAVLDINMDGSLDILDILLTAKNTCTAKPDQLGCPKCPPE